MVKKNQSLRGSDKSKHTFISSSISLHDRTQFETILDYKLQNNIHHKGVLNQRQTYEVDHYLFFPKQMDINPETYKRDDFYDDLRSLIRLKEPRYGYKGFLGLTKNNESPLKQIRTQMTEALEATDEVQQKVIIGRFVDAVRIFGCSFVRYFDRHINRSIKRLQGKGEPVDALAECEPFFRRAHQILNVYRSIADVLNNPKTPGEERMLREMRLVEELACYRFQQGAARINSTIEMRKIEGEPTAVQLGKRLRVWFRFHRWLFKKRGFLWVTHDSSPANHERFNTRLRFLKTKIWQPLFLEHKQQATFAFQRQMGYMLAAGLAGLSSFVANILILTSFAGSSANNMNLMQGAVGFGSVLVMVAFVGAYILRDRIKEIGRVKFHRGVFGNLPDNHQRVFHVDAANKHRVIGEIRESTSFLRGYRDLPPEVREYKKERLPNPLGSKEEIIHYRKIIKVDGIGVRRVGSAISAIKDISRLSIRRFIAKLDDPFQNFLFLDSSGETRSVSLPKVYSLDMVSVYRYWDVSSRNKRVAFDGRRVILNKRGLVRIED